METRASYLLIGVMTLVAITAIFMFVFWTLKGELDRSFAYYDVVFEDSVAGLTTGGDVQFQGIPVGSVTNIRVDEDDPTRVRVTVRIQVRDDFSIRSSSEAALQSQGITGVAFVQIVGGGAEGAPLPLITNPDNEDRPTIGSRRSYIQELFESAPEVVEQARATLQAVQNILSDENRELITGILRDANTITTTVANRSEEIDSSIESLSEFADSLGQTSDVLVGMADDIASIASTASELLDSDVREAINSVDAAADAFALLATDADLLLRRNEDAISSFTHQGLSQLAYLVVESRQLISTLDRVAQRLESDPSGFLFGGGQTTVEVNVPN